MAPRTGPGQEAVSPIIGTLLVLAITVLGMAGIMIWGAPTIEAVQAQNAQVGIIGEFEELRSNSIDLSIPDASRIPTVNVPRGTLSIEEGTRVMVTGDYGAAACDLHVTGWSDSSVATVDYTKGGCSGTTIEALEVVGSNAVKRHSQAAAASGTITIPATASFTPDVSTGDWLFRLTNGAALPTEADIYAEAWLLDSDMVSWRLETSNGGVAAYYDLGAVFSGNGPVAYIEKQPSLQEDEFTSGVYALRLRTLSDAGGSSSISGRGSHQVFLGLVGNHVRIDRDDVYRLRYDVQGALAEPWCNLLLQRNQNLATDLYAEDPALPCQQASRTAVRSVTYVPATVPFELEVLHANIRVTLA